MISKESRRVAGILLLVLPTVLYGGLFLLSQLVDDRSGYMANPLRQIFFARDTLTLACFSFCLWSRCATSTKPTSARSGSL
jgi:hypothetical protein